MSGSGLGAFNHYQQTIHNVLPIGGLDDGLSSIVPLGIGGVFNAAGAGKIWFDMSAWAEMLVTALADQASAVNGLVIRWSHDGVNEDANLQTAVTLALGVEYYNAFARRARWVTVDLTNGAIAQTALALRTFFFQTPALAGTGGGGNVTIIAPLGIQAAATSVATTDNSTNGPALGVSTAIAVNVAVNCGATVAGQKYRVSVAGGAGFCIRVDATNPLITDEPWWDGQKFAFIATVTGATGVRVIKRVAATADGAVILTAIV
jgi:hypothetical protein